MSSNRAVLYHANCVDGFTAAWAAWRRMPGARFIPVSYGDPTPDGLEDAEIYLVDFSYKKHQIEKLAEIAKSVIVLDHHASARDELAGFPELKENFIQMSGDFSGLHVKFDMSKSGARISWEFFHAHLRAPTMVRLVEDYDLWNFHLQGSRETHEFLSETLATMSHDEIELSFGLWGSYVYEMSGNVARILEAGGQIIRTKMALVEELTKGVLLRNMPWGPEGEFIAVPFTYAPKSLTDYLGEYLVEKGYPIAAIFRVDSNRNRLEVSLRSKKGNFNVAKIAAENGGGGHPSAAGFGRPLPENFIGSILNVNPLAWAFSRQGTEK